MHHVTNNHPKPITHGCAIDGGGTASDWSGHAEGSGQVLVGAHARCSLFCKQFTVQKDHQQRDHDEIKRTTEHYHSIEPLRQMTDEGTREKLDVVQRSDKRKMFSLFVKRINN